MPPPSWPALKPGNDSDDEGETPGVADPPMYAPLADMLLNAIQDQAPGRCLERGLRVQRGTALGPRYSLGRGEVASPKLAVGTPTASSIEM